MLPPPPPLPPLPPLPSLPLPPLLPRLLTSLRFRTSDYPFLCMAYKIPHGLPVTAAVQVKGYDWRSIAVTTTLHSFTSLGHWDNAMGADSIMDDDK